MTGLKLLLDTDVLVDYLRGNKEAEAYFEKLNCPIFISAITMAELFAGVKEGKEKAILSHFLKAFEVIPVNEKIAEQGGVIKRDYGKSQGVGLADALIAATSEYIGSTLITCNRKHFPMLKKILVPYSKKI
jgi:hypothetical protein